MIHRPYLSSRRAGFTLIELLVVIAIIAILVGLLMSAVMYAMLKIPETKTRTEIAQMETALQTFMQDHGVQSVPSVLLLREDNNYAPIGSQPRDNVAAASHRFLIKAFGKNLGRAGAIDWNGNGTADSVDLILDGSQVLVFLTGGIPSPPGSPYQGTGFASSNVNPAATPRQTPYFTFATNRLGVKYPNIPSDPNYPNFLVQRFYYYVDPWQSPSNPPLPTLYDTNNPNHLVGVPYAFFSTGGVQNAYSLTDCSFILAEPYWDKAPGNWAASSTYQIISAGRNGGFGGQGSNNGASWNSSGGGTDNYGRDDQANFAKGLLFGGN